MNIATNSLNYAILLRQLRVFYFLNSLLHVFLFKYMNMKKVIPLVLQSSVTKLKKKCYKVEKKITKKE